MKFKVRKDFTCQVIVKDPQGNEIMNTFPGGTDVDFDAATAALHKHKLEAVDKAAARFLLPGAVDDTSIDADQAAAQSAAAAGVPAPQ